MFLCVCPCVAGHVVVCGGVRECSASFLQRPPLPLGRGGGRHQAQSVYEDPDVGAGDGWKRHTVNLSGCSSRVQDVSRCSYARAGRFLQDIEHEQVGTHVAA